MLHEGPYRLPLADGWKVLGILSFATFATMAQAQDADVAEEDDSRCGIGLGAAVIERPYRDYDDELKAIPIVYFENRWIDINGGRIDFKVNDRGAFKFRLRARYALDGYEASESDYLQGMEDRDSSAWLGAAVTWENRIADVSIEYLTDAMGNSEGSRGRVEAEHRFRMGRFGLTPRVAAEWVDQEYVAYYYGVRPEEAALDRPAYVGQASVNVEAGLRLDYSPTRRHTFFLDIGTVRLGDEIEQSPLVDRSAQTRLSVGYLRHF